MNEGLRGRKLIIGVDRLDYSKGILERFAGSLRGLTRSVRLLANEAEKAGGDWREAITFVRNMAPTIWQRLPERDRIRFLRHVRACVRWEWQCTNLGSSGAPVWSRRYARYTQAIALERNH